MTRERLSDEQVAGIRSLAAEGDLSLTDIAKRFGTSRQHVSRLVKSRQRQQLVAGTADGIEGSVVTALRTLLAGLKVKPAENVHAATAVALAEKLDAVRRTDTASGAMAAPGLARALSESLIALQDQAPESGPRLGRLRGEEAELVARELGYPDPEHVDIKHFNALELLRLQRARRLNHLRAGPHRPAA